MKYCLECKLSSCRAEMYFDTIDDVNISNWTEITRIGSDGGTTKYGNQIIHHLGYCEDHSI